jgi:hypothetical protein
VRQIKERTFTIRAEPTLLEWLEQESERRDVSVGSIVRALVRVAMQGEVDNGGRGVGGVAGGIGVVDGRTGDDAERRDRVYEDDQAEAVSVGDGGSGDVKGTAGGVGGRVGKKERLPKGYIPKGAGKPARMTGIRPGPRERVDGFEEQVGSEEGE